MVTTSSKRAVWLTASAVVAASAVPAAGEVYLNEAQALAIVLGERAVVRKEQKTRVGVAPSVKCILENISHGTREPVLPIVQMRQGIFSEVRSADAPGNIWHGPERLVQDVVQLENNTR